MTTASRRLTSLAASLLLAGSAAAAVVPTQPIPITMVEVADATHFTFTLGRTSPVTVTVDGTTTAYGVRTHRVLIEGEAHQVHRYVHPPTGRPAMALDALPWALLVDRRFSPAVMAEWERQMRIHVEENFVTNGVDWGRLWEAWSEIAILIREAAGRIGEPEESTARLIEEPEQAAPEAVGVGEDCEGDSCREGSGPTGPSGATGATGPTWPTGPGGNGR